MTTNSDKIETIIPPLTTGQYISQRIIPLDLARFIAMVMMIQGHTIYALASPDVIDPSVFPWNIWNFIRGFTAPVFLIVSGSSHVFANRRDENGKLTKKTIKKRIRTALMLITVGYLLHFPAERIWDIFYVGANEWSFFFQVNILQLIGITLLMLLGLFIITRNDKSLGITSLVIALAITFLTPLVHKVNWFDFLPEFIAAYLSPERTSIFPIFPFSAFIFYGTALGTFLKKYEPDDRVKFLIRYGFPIGIGIFLIGFLVNEIINENITLNTPMSNIGLTMLRVGSVMVGLPFVSLIWLKTKRLGKYYSLFGKKALFIYIAHLLIIYGTVIFPGLYKIFSNNLNLFECLIAVLFVEFVAIFSAWFYDYTVHKYEKAKTFYKVIVGAYLLIALII